MKRIITAILMVSTLFVISRGISDLDVAKTWLDALKAFFWMIVGGLAFSGFLGDFRENKWPFFN